MMSLLIVLMNFKGKEKLLFQVIRQLCRQFFKLNLIATELKHVVNNQVEKEEFDDSDIEKAIKHVEETLEIEYDDTQKNAIKNALNNPISILTGGPGTGKTTIINGI